MAKYLYHGGRLDSVSIAGGTVTEDTVGYDATYADCSLYCGSSASNAFRATFYDDTGAAINLATGETGYFHFEYSDGSSAGVTGDIFQLRDSNDYPWLAIRQFGSSGGQVLALYYNSGTGAAPVWTQIGATQTYADGTRHAHDVKVTIGSPNVVEWSVDNNLVIGPSNFTQAGFTSARSVVHAGAETSRFSQLLGTEGISTINAKVRYSRPTGAGTTNTFTSAAYTNVNEQVNADSSLDQSLTAGQKVTYAMGDVTTPSGFKIGAVEHCIRGKNDGGAPANVKSVVRSAGTDYASANIPGVGTSFGPLRARRTTDPATGVGWTDSGWNAAEAGYQSAT